MSLNVFKPPLRHSSNTSGANSSSMRSVSGAETAVNSPLRRESTMFSMSSERISASTAASKPRVF